MESEKDHLFVSYAWEDGALAEWLTLKLTAAGYLVWCDRFKILGGDRWPEKIDEAIKTRTHRMIHLLSSHSLHKPNPSAERQLALNIGKAWGQPFLIPLNVDGVPETEIPWQLTDIAYIDFSKWGRGLLQLLETLERGKVPRPRQIDGKWVAAATCLPLNVTSEDLSDRLESNCLPFIHIPEVVKRFVLSRSLSKQEQGSLRRSFAFYPISDTELLSFHAPPAETLSVVGVRDAGGAMWRCVSSINGIAPGDIISTLLLANLSVRCYAKGLCYDEDSKVFYFPRGLIEKDRIVYMGYRGRKTRIGYVGTRTLPNEVLWHHLAFRFRIRRGILDDPVAQLCLRLHMYDANGVKVEGKQIGGKRKKVTKSWWNHEWLSRQMAIRAFLSDGTNEIMEGGTTPDTKVVLSSIPLCGIVRPGINDKSLAPLRLRVVQIQDAEPGVGPLEETELSKADEGEDTDG